MKVDTSSEELFSLAEQWYLSCGDPNVGHAMAKALRAVVYEKAAALERLTRIDEEIERATQAQPVAWGVPNTRPTERAPFMQVLLDITSAQYPELLVPLYAAPEAPQAPASAWRPIDDGAKDGTQVLLSRWEGGRLVCAQDDYWVSDAKCWCDWDSSRQPTHYQPLPAGPAQEDSNGQ